MYEPLDWSDLSKLQTRNGFPVIAAFKSKRDSFDYWPMLVIYEDGSGHPHDVYCLEDGRRSGEDSLLDIIPRLPPPPAKPKTKLVKLCRPEFECVPGYDCIDTDLRWHEEQVWNRRMTSEPKRYGPLEYREFEVPES